VLVHKEIQVHKEKLAHKVIQDLLVILEYKALQESKEDQE
jgi:hypothetical protein